MLKCGSGKGDGMTASSCVATIAARFEAEVKPGDIPAAFPHGASAALSGTEVSWQSNGRPRRDRRVRMWVSTWSNIERALDFLNRRDAHIPVLSEAEECLVALGAPFASRGEVNWSEDGRAESLFPTLWDDPGGDAPVMVMTTLGLVTQEEASGDFARANLAIRDAFATNPAVPVDLQMLPDRPFLDGPTVSLWTSQAAMLQEAYAENPHRAAVRLRENRVGRGSFTRMRIRHLEGSWNGVDAASIPW